MRNLRFSLAGTSVRRCHIVAFLTAALIIPFTATANAEETSSVVPAAFAKDTPESDFTILYDDLDAVLRQIVLVTGHSSRDRPAKPRPAAGSHIIRGASSKYGLEGNRVHFPALAKKENLALLSRIRSELEAVPSQLPLHMVNKDEQLAYWLNLYNIVVLEQVALIYPENRLKKQFRGRSSLWDKKLVTVAGLELSLNDIQHKIIVPKFQNPLVMYGMFQGFVGGPNIRNEAYKGSEVYTQLRENADEFVNSNRGMRAKERLLRISHLYSVNKALFPNWNKDVRAHLTRFASDHYREKIRKASRLSPKTTGFEIADIYNGSASRGSAMSTNTAAFLGSIEAVQYGSTAEGHFGDTTYIANDGGQLASILVPRLQASSRDGGRFPSHVVQYLLQINARNKNREGDVTIEELENKNKNTAPESQEHSTEWSDIVY